MSYEFHIVFLVTGNHFGQTAEAVEDVGRSEVELCHCRCLVAYVCDCLVGCGLPTIKGFGVLFRCRSRFGFVDCVIDLAAFACASHLDLISFIAANSLDHGCGNLGRINSHIFHDLNREELHSFVEAAYETGNGVSLAGLNVCHVITELVEENGCLIVGISHREFLCIRCVCCDGYILNLDVVVEHVAGNHVESSLCRSDCCTCTLLAESVVLNLGKAVVEFVCTLGVINYVTVCKGGGIVSVEKHVDAGGIFHVKIFAALPNGCHSAVDFDLCTCREVEHGTETVDNGGSVECLGDDSGGVLALKSDSLHGLFAHDRDGLCVEVGGSCGGGAVESVVDGGSLGSAGHNHLIAPLTLLHRKLGSSHLILRRLTGLAAEDDLAQLDHTVVGGCSAIEYEFVILVGSRSSDCEVKSASACLEILTVSCNIYSIGKIAIAGYRELD